MTLHSKTCSIKYFERKPITLYEKTCLSVCRRRRQCLKKTERPVGDRPGRPGEHRNPEAQIWTLLDKQKEQNFAECQARFNQHEFQAARAEEVQQRDQLLLKDFSSSKIWNCVKLTKEVSLKWKS